MPAIDRSLDNVDFLSDDFRGAIRRRLGELCGLVLIIVSVTLAAALATWSVQDPSLSHATDAPVRNLLGAPGAIAADLLIQLFGLAAIVVVLPVAVWGWRLLTHRPVEREWLRLILWFCAVMAAAAFASALPRLATWPLPAGLGGVTGDAILRLPLAIMGGSLAGMSRLILAGICGLLALAAFIGAVGFGWRSRETLADDLHREAEEFEEDDERTSISLGWIVHALLSLKAWVGRMLARRVAARTSTRGATRNRAEPRFTGRRAAAAEENDAEDEEEEYEDDEEEEEEEEAPRRARAAPQPKPRRLAISGAFTLPSLNLLAAPKASDRFTPSTAEIEENAESLESVLEDFGVKGEIINARPGPVVTLYELEPAPGIKSSRVIGLADDIARSMSAVSARVAVVAGRNAIGIE
jgi:S-DNA-T family DNA segregation ATPase FtsK/SpoIIIE